MFNHALQLLKDTSVGSIAPTAAHCAKQMLKSVNFEKARMIVEYGPGDGALTKFLLDKIHPDCRLVLVETNDHFVSELRERFKDARVEIVHDSAENIFEIRKSLNFNKADYIISGIPFTLISDTTGEEIVRSSYNVLRAGGRMIVYQSLTTLGAKKSIKKRMRKQFHLSRNKYFLLNLPPLYVFEASAKKDPLFI